MNDSRLFRVHDDWRLRSAGLPHGAEIPVLGIPVRFETDDAGLEWAAREAFGHWGAVAGRSDLLSEERLTVRLLLRHGDEGTEEHAPLRYFQPDARCLVVATPGSLGISDARHREVVAWVTPGLLADFEHFRYGFLESLTLLALSWLDRLPVHAAAVARGGTALLLAGPSNVGKSTLSYAGARSGLTLLAEDVVYLATEPRPRAWGLARRVHLPPAGRAFFPELADHPDVLLANGKRKMVAEVPSGSADDPLGVAERVGLCMLDRGPRTRLMPLQAAEAAMELASRHEGGFDLFADTAAGVIERFLDHGKAWRMELGGGPDEAVPHLHRMLDEIDRAAVADTGA